MTLASFINKIGFKVNEQDVNKVNNTMQSIKSTAQKLLGTIGIGLSLTAINSLVEEYSRINDQIRNSTSELGDQLEIQQQIMEAAKATHSSYELTADTVSNLVKENKNLFGDIGEAVKFNNAATMLFKSAGKTNQEIAGLMESINKSFAKGYVDSETMSQLLEKSPEAIELLNKKLGTTSNKLEELASSRVMTVADLKAAFVDNADAIEQKFAGTQYKISDALTVIRSEWGFWLSQMDSTLGVTSTIANGITKMSTVAMGGLNRVRNGVVWLGEKVGGTENALKLLAIAAGAFITVMSGTKILAFVDNLSKKLGGVQKILGGIKAKTVALAAGIILVALLVEDFINFLQGNDSVIGELFNEAGIGADRAREVITGAFNKIRDIVVTVWMTIQSFLGEHSEEIRTMFESVWGVIWQRLVDIFKALYSVAASIFGTLQAFWERWGDKIMAVFSILAQFIGRTVERIISIITQIAEVISAFRAGDFKGVLLSLLGIAQAIFEQLLDTVKTIFAAIWAFIGDKVIAIKDSIVEGFTAAIDWIKSLPEQAVQWGSDIIQGIVDGIKGTIGGIGEAASGIAGKIKSFLGFSEPEEGPLSDFHTYMPDMVSLMAEGIQAGKGRIKTALEELTGDMSILAQNKAVAPGTVRSVSNTSNVSRSIVQNVNINNAFNGDKAIQQKAASAMDKSASDVTAELARGLAYAR